MKNLTEKNGMFADFTDWLDSKNAVSFALAVGVIFLITNYSMILFLTNPENELFAMQYGFWINSILSHIEALFFGLSTAIIMFQGKSNTWKVIFCIFEGVMIALNTNRKMLDGIRIDLEIVNFTLSGNGVLGIYLAIFSACTLYVLGSLAKMHREEKKINEGYENKIADLNKQAQKLAQEKSEIEALHKEMDKRNDLLQKWERQVKERENAVKQDEDLKEEARVVNEAKTILREQKPKAPKNDQEPPKKSDGYADTIEAAERWFADKKALKEFLLGEGFKWKKLDVIAKFGISDTTYHRAINNIKLIKSEVKIVG